jgi:hypothetical protein
MGIKRARLKPFEGAATAIAGSLVRATKGGLLDLTQKTETTLYEGTDMATKAGGDPTGRIASLLAATMAKRLPIGDGDGDSPEAELLGYVVPLAKPLAKAYVGRFFGVLGSAVRGAVGLFRRARR